MIEHLPSSLVVPPLVKAVNFSFHHDKTHETETPLGHLVEKVFIDGVINNLNTEGVQKYEEYISDPGVYNELKDFNSIVLLETKARFNYKDQASGLNIRKNTKYLSIHLREQNGTFREKMEEVQKAMESVGYYLLVHRDRLPNYPLIGITYEKLALAARLYGFSVAEQLLPDNVTKDIKNVLIHAYGLKGVHQDPIRICFQSYDDVIQETIF